jgi:hypothetical protein
MLWRPKPRAIEYLQTELAVLRELLGKKRLLLNDNQRRRLGGKGPDTGTLAPGGSGDDRDSGHDPPLAPPVDGPKMGF